MRRALPLSVASLALVVGVACGGASTPGDATPTTSLDPTTFALQVASTDLVANEPSRLQVGVVQTDQAAGVHLLTAGTIQLAVGPYEGGNGTPVEGDASYIPAPGTPGDASGEPALTTPDLARGVYELGGVTFDSPGIWEAAAAFTVDGSRLTLSARFEVRDDHLLPAPGDRALRTKNLTIETADDPQALDSQAQDGAELPDPELHRETIAGAIADGRPVLALFATPVYCQSQFCGPTTDALQDLAAEGPADVAYIHIEIWNDYGQSAINRAAADWLLREQDLTEPWLYLIDERGTIVDRWGPLFDPDEVASELAAL